MRISKSKKISEEIAKVCMCLAMLIVFGFVFSVLWTIFSKGMKAMSWDMVSKLPGGGFYIGKEGGFLNAIVGSLYIVGASTLIGLLISIPVVFFLNVYLKKGSKVAYLARLAFDVLFGVPSIVYGAFGFTIMIFFGLRTSLLGGIIVITLLIIPIFIRTMEKGYAMLADCNMRMEIGCFVANTYGAIPNSPCWMKHRTHTLLHHSTHMDST